MAQLETTADHVAAARRAATQASLDGRARWSELTLALEANAGSAEPREEVLSALAELTYSWAVYHSTAADADGRDGR